VVRRQLFSLAAAGALIASLAGVAPASAAPPVQVTAGPPLGLVIPRDAHASGGHTGSSSNLLFHNGEIIPIASVTAIFWGPGWTSYTGDKVTGIDKFYKGFNGSTYANTSDEYSGTNGQVTSALTYNGNLVDGTAASGGGSTSAILSEVAREITTPVLGGYYPVYVDLPRGSAGYCGWHSWGTINGVLVQFAFFWNLDGDPGCNPQSTVLGESQGLAAIANTSAHELSEARTDPDGTGWYDRQGQENGDKCNWNFLGQSSVTFSNGSQWKVQSEWSNKAGGCIDSARS
jgi:hypothetical protein